MSTGHGGEDLEVWSRWFQDQRLGAESLTGMEASASLCGVDGAHLEAVQGSERITVFGPRGSDRCAVARRIHDLARPGSVLIRLDGASSGVEAVIGALTATLRDASSESSMPRPALFVDEAQELGVDALQVLLQLSTTTFDLILGAEPGTVDGVGEVVEIVPLTERRSEIPTIVRRLTARYKNPPQLDAEALDALRAASWVGDLEQLRATVRHLAMAHRGQAVTAKTVGALVGRGDGGSPPDRSLADLEREHIYRVLDHFAWNRTRSARSLGIDVKTLYNKLKRYEASTSNSA